MSHVVQFFEFPYNTPEKEIYAEIEEWGEYASDYEESGGTYHGNFKLLPDKEFKTREEAENYLNSLGSYVDRGVIFYKYPKVEPKSSMKKITEQIEKIKSQALKYAYDHSVQNQKAKFIGCEHCKSKINKECISKEFNKMSLKVGKFDYKDWDDKKDLKFIHYEQKCPVCGGDLRAEYIQKKLDEYANKINELNAKYRGTEKTINDKNFKKAEKFWLCKAEEHC